MRGFTEGELHENLLKIAEEFHKICSKHAIPYYMLGGTMLGAIRHNGFIPWDDDMDFGVPREHYHRFVQIAEKELPSHYAVITYTNSTYAMMGFAKVMDETTRIEEEFQPRGNEMLGVNIDVFPLDHCNGNKGLLSANFRTRAMFKLQKLLFVESKNRPWPKKMLAWTAQRLIPIGRTKIPRYQDRQLSARAYKGRDTYGFYANFFGAWGLKEIVSKEVFGTPVLYPFENIELYGVKYPDTYLEHLYGDYMQIPPEEHRHIHQINAFALNE